MISTPSASLAVMMRRLASWSMTSLASTSWPSTWPAMVALARPAPIDWATCITETGDSNSRRLPSGSVILIMGKNEVWSGCSGRLPWEIWPLLDRIGGECGT